MRQRHGWQFLSMTASPKKSSLQRSHPRPAVSSRQRRHSPDTRSHDRGSEALMLPLHSHGRQKSPTELGKKGIFYTVKKKHPKGQITFPPKKPRSALISPDVPYSNGKFMALSPPFLSSLSSFDFFPALNSPRESVIVIRCVACAAAKAGKMSTKAPTTPILGRAEGIR